MTTTPQSTHSAELTRSTELTRTPAETADEVAAALQIRGSRLSEQETAAVVAVLARLAATEPVHSDAGATGPADRTVQRHHRMLKDQRGIWGRPGPGSWSEAGGIR